MVIKKISSHGPLDIYKSQGTSELNKKSGKSPFESSDEEDNVSSESSIDSN